MSLNISFEYVWFQKITADSMFWTVYPVCLQETNGLVRANSEQLLYPSVTTRGTKNQKDIGPVGRNLNSELFLVVDDFTTETHPGKKPRYCISILPETHNEHTDYWTRFESHSHQCEDWMRRVPTPV